MINNKLQHDGLTKKGVAFIAVVVVVFVDFFFAFFGFITAVQVQKKDKMSFRSRAFQHTKQRGLNESCNCLCPVPPPHHTPNSNQTVNTETFQSVAVSEKTNNQKSNKDQVRAPDHIKIDVYGGSITFGAGVDKSSRYSHLLQESLRASGHNVTVNNLAIPASCVEHHLLCGIQEADIIISEYRINCWQSESALVKWYRLATAFSRHVIILDVWSWLSPPRVETSLSVQATTGNLQNETEKISIVSMEKMHLYSWRSFVSSFFNYSHAEFDGACNVSDVEPCLGSIGKKCFDSRLEDNAIEKQIVQECRSKYANSMQHGKEAYHQLSLDFFNFTSLGCTFCQFSAP